jgi:hypothetical protein
MRDFSANGLWFLDEEPENRVAGTLRYSDRGLQLRLMGGFKEGWTPGSEGYPLIRGVVSKNPYGDFVTLMDCFTTRRNLSSAGIGTETIQGNRAIVGDSHLPPDHAAFEAAEVSLSYLTDWYARTGFIREITQGSGFEVGIRYRKPELTRFVIGDAELSLGLFVRSNESAHGASVIEEARCSIRPVANMTVKDVQNAFVQPLQDLLSFATDTPNSVEEFELLGEKVPHGQMERHRRYHYLYRPVLRLRRKRDHLFSSDMIFTFEEAQDAGLNIFERWIQFTKRHEAFCTVYFSSLYAPPKFLDERLQTLMSAFSLLATSPGEASERMTGFVEELDGRLEDRFTEEERSLLRHVMPISPELEMPFRLSKLLEEHRPLMRQIIGDDLKGFVRSVCRTLEFVKRRVTADGLAPLQGNELYLAMQKLRVLIKVMILTELGFDQAQVANAITRNKYFLHMKGL